MTIFIKNMVCSRCKMIVQSAFERLGMSPLSVDLGEIVLDKTPTPEQLTDLDLTLKQYGFERIDDRKSLIIEKIKTTIVELVHYTEGSVSKNLSGLLTDVLHLDYNYLSNLFSEVEGTTIEKYLIAQRIEKAKELILYDELTLSEIADRLGYSSVAYLSNQFKKVTGSTPTFYKTLKDHNRQNIEEL